MTKMVKRVLQKNLRYPLIFSLNEYVDQSIKMKSFLLVIAPILIQCSPDSIGSCAEGDCKSKTGVFECKYQFFCLR